jgi:hypothetical protein
MLSGKRLNSNINKEFCGMLKCIKKQKEICCTLNHNVFIYGAEYLIVEEMKVYHFKSDSTTFWRIT